MVSKNLLTEALELNRYLEQLVAVLTLKKPTCKKLKKIIATEVCSSWKCMS